MLRRGHLVALGLTMVGTIGAAPFALRFAAPEIIIFHGGALRHSIVVASWSENHTLLAAAPVQSQSDGPAAPLGARPYIEMALFWGNSWRTFAEDSARRATLTPAEANQHGRFYPGYRGAPAVILLAGTTRHLSDSALALLRKHHIPVEMPAPRSQPSI